jgi:hypothetical protein
MGSAHASDKSDDLTDRRSLAALLAGVLTVCMEQKELVAAEHVLEAIRALDENDASDPPAC